MISKFLQKGEKQVKKAKKPQKIPYIVYFFSEVKA